MNLGVLHGDVGQANLERTSAGFERERPSGRSPGGRRGLLRFRVVALGLSARCVGDAEGSEARARAESIARTLEDEDLLGRV